MERLGIPTFALYLNSFTLLLEQGCSSIAHAYAWTLTSMHTYTHIHTNVKCVFTSALSQELLAVQLVHAFSEVFQDAGLPLRLRHYDVLVTSNRCASRR